MYCQGEVVENLKLLEKLEFNIFFEFQVLFCKFKNKRDLQSQIDVQLRLE